MYQPLEIKTLEVCGIPHAVKAMRVPKGTIGDSLFVYGQGFILGQKDSHLAANLVKAGPDHAKAMRGIQVWAELKMQVGWMIEFVTYRVGVEDLSTSSSMHNELKSLSGYSLAEQKQLDLVDKQYTRICTISYQALRNMYRARKNHRHPDWDIFCKWVEQLPYFKVFIYPES